MRFPFAGSSSLSCERWRRIKCNILYPCKGKCQIPNTNQRIRSRVGSTVITLWIVNVSYLLWETKKSFTQNRCDICKLAVRCGHLNPECLSSRTRLLIKGSVRPSRPSFSTVVTRNHDHESYIIFNQLWLVGHTVTCEDAKEEKLFGCCCCTQRLESRRHIGRGHNCSNSTHIRTIIFLSQFLKGVTVTITIIITTHGTLASASETDSETANSDTRWRRSSI